MESASGSDQTLQQAEPFDFGVRLGLVLIGEAACVSALTVGLLLLYILYSSVTLKGFHVNTTCSWRVSTQIHYYFINLLVSDLIQAVGGIIDIKWALEATVQEGVLCTAQGILKQMGDVGVALTSLAITIHTFSVLVLRLYSKPRTVLLVIAAIWLFMVLIVTIGLAAHRRQDYYGATQYCKFFHCCVLFSIMIELSLGCWITSDFDGERIALDLKLQRDKVKQYQKKLQAILDREEVIAKTHLAAGQKDKALIALRRRKYQQSLLIKTDGQLENLEQLVSTIEFSLVEVSVLHGLKQGNDVLKEIHKEMNPESVERLLEETAEARAYQEEINEMLANNLSLDEEDAVQTELRELEAALVITLPEAPSTAPAAQDAMEAEPSQERVKQRIALPS
ncbi:hypothetical protein D9758_000391 [Tetrapyrgos nigripes]|uniref:Uncharacterized protein n=1 Tax=Tetrapyrgos nigripes TaxID=182062 RepID=A0A8H5H1A2_9AGAR|nr:hypothetical protein D9758_000391 [Tetrapyrgos nigripes]